MQSGRARRADVHGWTLPNRFETFEDLDLVSPVVLDRAAAVGASVGRLAACRLAFRLVGVLILQMFHVCPLLLRHLARVQIRMGMMT
jgi:hypothetical protein